MEQPTYNITDVKNNPCPLLFIMLCKCQYMYVNTSCIFVTESDCTSQLLNFYVILGTVFCITMFWNHYHCNHLSNARQPTNLIFKTEKYKKKKINRIKHGSSIENVLFTYTDTDFTFRYNKEQTDKSN